MIKTIAAYLAFISLPAPTDNSLYNGFAAGKDNALAVYFSHTDPSLKATA